MSNGFVSGSMALSISLAFTACCHQGSRQLGARGISRREHESGRVRQPSPDSLATGNDIRGPGGPCPWLGHVTWSD